MLDALSIGYFVRDSDVRSDGVRLLKDLDLLEVSLCAFGANPSALVTAVKSGGDIMSIAQRMAARGLAPLDPVRLPSRLRSLGERVSGEASVKAFVAGHAQEARVELADLSIKTLVISLPTTADARVDQLEAMPPGSRLPQLHSRLADDGEHRQGDQRHRHERSRARGRSDRHDRHKRPEA